MISVDVEEALWVLENKIVPFAVFTSLPNQRIDNISFIIPNIDAIDLKKYAAYSFFRSIVNCAGKLRLTVQNLIPRRGDHYGADVLLYPSDNLHQHSKYEEHAKLTMKGTCEVLEALRRG
jgi:hypothetical protein